MPPGPPAIAACLRAPHDTSPLATAAAAHTLSQTHVRDVGQADQLRRRGSLEEATLKSGPRHQIISHKQAHRQEALARKQLSFSTTSLLLSSVCLVAVFGAVLWHLSNLTFNVAISK